MKHLSVAAVFLVATALPGTAQNSLEAVPTHEVVCPVTINSAHMNYEAAQPKGITMDLRSQSEKRVLGTEFGLAIRDGMGDLEPYPRDISGLIRLDPGKKHTIVASLAFINIYQPKYGLLIYVKKLSYKDGTTWEDGGTQQCQYRSENRH